MSRAMFDVATALALAASPAWAGDEGPDEEAAREIARPRFAVGCALEIVLDRLDVAPRADVELPQVFFESATPLPQFQDAIAPQWGFRPHVFTNAFVAARNEIYLLDSASAYGRAHHTIDDSLAHELTHYVQAKYLGMILDDDPSLEMQAIDVQTWFRDERARGALSRESCDPHRRS